MIHLKRTLASDEDFRSLVGALDKELAITDGDDHDFYHQFNGIENIKHIIVAYENNRPIACGALKEYDAKTMEVKRMYTSPEGRGKGIATKILGELESWAKSLSYKSCILETGANQHAALALYKKLGYTVIPNYGQYIGVENSFCFQKEL